MAQELRVTTGRIMFIGLGIEGAAERRGRERGGAVEGPARPGSDKKLMD